jgi:hypothetical protein
MVRSGYAENVASSNSRTTPLVASVAIGLTLLVSILGAFGVHTTVKGFQPAAKK